MLVKLLLKFVILKHISVNDKIVPHNPSIFILECDQNAFVNSRKGIPNSRIL